METEIDLLEEAPSAEPEAPTSATPSTLCALTQGGRAVFTVPAGQYLVTINISDVNQTISVSGRTSYARLSPLSSREVVSAVVESAGTITVVVEAPEKTNKDGLLVTCVPVLFQ